jgi:predicted MFS family arabinose efflux permease
MLLILALMGLILGATVIPQRHSRVLGAGLVACGIALSALFAASQRRARPPLIPPPVVKEPRLRLGIGTSFLNTATTSSLVTLATLYLQQARHATPAAAGLRLLPFSLCVMLGSALAGRTLPRSNPARGISAGLGLIAVGNAATLLVPVTETLLPFCVAVAGLGIGVSSVGSTTLATGVCSELQSSAAGILNTAAQLGTALGVSAAVLLANATQHAKIPLHGPTLSWAVAGLLALYGALLALRGGHSGQPTSSVRRPPPATRARQRRSRATPQNTT